MAGYLSAVVGGRGRRKQRRPALVPSLPDSTGCRPPVSKRSDVSPPIGRKCRILETSLCNRVFKIHGISD